MSLRSILAAEGLAKKAALNPLHTMLLRAFRAQLFQGQHGVSLGELGPLYAEVQNGPGDGLFPSEAAWKKFEKVLDRMISDLKAEDLMQDLFPEGYAEDEPGWLVVVQDIEQDDLLEIYNNADDFRLNSSPMDDGSIWFLEEQDAKAFAQGVKDAGLKPSIKRGAAQGWRA